MSKNTYYKTKKGFLEVFNDYCSFSLSINRYCKNNEISKVTFYKYKQIYNITKKQTMVSEEIMITPVTIINEKLDDRIIVNGFKIRISNINDTNLIRILRVIKFL